jgi:hypothetical protein
VDPSQLTADNWPTALVLVVFLICVLVVPSVLTYLGNKQVKAVRTSLEENNGGSSVRDALDRIERGMGNLDQRLAKVEQDAKQARKPRRLFG